MTKLISHKDFDSLQQQKNISHNYDEETLDAFRRAITKQNNHSSDTSQPNGISCSGCDNELSDYFMSDSDYADGTKKNHQSYLQWMKCLNPGCTYGITPVRCKNSKFDAWKKIMND